MYTCPSCNKETISAKDKFKANRASPARCSECQQLSSVSGNIEGLIHVLLQALVPVSLIAAFYYWTWIPIIVLVGLAIILEYLMYKYAQLKPITEKEVKNLNLLYSLGLAAVLIMVIFTVINNA